MPARLFRVGAGGVVVTLYKDDGPDLGPARIARASEVEPGLDGKWQVKLTDHPENAGRAGEVVGQGFARRADALRAEVEFINREILRKGEKHG